VPLALETLVIEGLAGIIRIVRVFVPVPLALVARIFTVKFPGFVGFPEINPLVGFKLSPDGRVPFTEKLCGELLPVIV
jgi:hypothetical protein